MAQFKLCIQDDNESNLFYNAVGGKSAGRMVKVVLVETLTQRVVTDQVVKLAVSLTYESGQFVSNPEICRTLKNSCLTIDHETPALINFRIDDVSSHHQGQLFRLVVSPVVEDENNSTSTIHSSHIDSVFSDPIEVRSKVVFTKKEKKVANASASEDDFDGDDTISLLTTNATVKSVNKSQQRHSKSTSTCSKKLKTTPAAVTIGSTAVSNSIASTHKVSFDNSNILSSTATSTTAAPVINTVNPLCQLQHNFASVSCDDLDQLESSLLYLLPLAHTIKNTLSTSSNVRHQQQTSTVQCEVLTSVVQTAVILAEQMETLTAIVQQTKFQQQQQFQQMQQHQQALVTSTAVTESTENSCNSNNWDELFSRQSSNVINDNNDSSNSDIIIITEEIFNSNTAFITTTSPSITPFATLSNTTAANTTANMNDMIVKPILCRGYSSSWDSEFPSSNNYYDDNNNNNCLFRGMNNSNIIADNDDSDVEGSSSNNNNSNNLYSAVVGQKRKYSGINNFDNTTVNNDAVVPMPRLSRQSSFTTIIIESILGLDYTTTNS